jgi:hypothetical protein
MRDEFSAVRGEIATQIAGVREDIEETHRHMRVLHEDVISRLAIIQEGQVTRRPSPRRKRK